MRNIFIATLLLLFCSKLFSQNCTLTINEVTFNREKSVYEVNARFKFFEKSKIKLVQEIDCFSFDYYFVLYDSLKPFRCNLLIKGFPPKRKEFKTFRKGMQYNIRFLISIDNVIQLTNGKVKQNDKKIMLQIFYKNNWFDEKIFV